MNFKYRVTVINGGVTYLANDITYGENIVSISNPTLDLPEGFVAKHKIKHVRIPINSALVETLA